MGDLLFDPEIKCTLHQLKQEWRAVEEFQEATMANVNKQNDRTMKDYLTPTLQECSSNIMRLLV